MIGAVQLLAIGYKQARLPEEISREIGLLRSSSAVRLLDVHAVAKANNRTLTVSTIDELSDWDGELIRRLLSTARASRVLNSYTVDSSGVLTQGDPVPDLRETLPMGTNVVYLLIEHRWARLLEDAIHNGAAYPLAGGWIGRDTLKDAGLEDLAG